MVTAETNTGKYRFRCLTKGVAQVELGHQAAGGRTLGTKGKGFATQVVFKVRQAVCRLDFGAGVGDEVGDEGFVFHALGDGLRTRHQAPRLHTGQPAKPGQLHLVVAEGGYRCRIGFYRDITNVYVELLGKVIGHAAKALYQLRFILIRNSRKHEGLCLYGSDGRKRQKAGNQPFP